MCSFNSFALSISVVLASKSRHGSDDEESHYVHMLIILMNMMMTVLVIRSCDDDKGSFRTVFYREGWSQ